MAENTFQYITRPSTQGNSITTMPKYRGTKTQEQTYAAVAAHLAGATPTVANVIHALGEVIVDGTINGWKVPVADGLLVFLCGCGGSSPIGQEPPNTFREMGIDLRCHYGEAGRLRAEAAFSAEKVGEQGRVAPVWVEVYDSASKSSNHYVSPGTLTIVLGNRNGKFDPAETGHRVRFRKADGTWVSAGGYPYIKGNTIVVSVPAGLTGVLELEITMELNGSLRTSTYPFQLS